MVSLVILLPFLLLLCWYYLKRKYNYWSDRGVAFAKPKFIVGNMQNIITRKANFGEVMRDCYHELKGKGPVGGVYLFTEPLVLITDVDMLRNVFVRDFQYFHDRGLYVNERDDPLSAHLFSLEGGQWKNLRNKLSPTFTSGKMKMMHGAVLSVADQFKEHLQELCGKSRGVSEMEFRELFASFTTDVIGNIAFGIDCNSIKDPESAFRQIGKRINEPNLKFILMNMFTSTFPKLSQKLGLKVNDEEVTEFFLNMLADSIEYRQQNNVKRNDFLSLLMQLMSTGQLEGEESSDLGKLTFNELAAQVFLFFFAGFDTSSSTMTFAFYELAINPEIQQRAREEVREVMQRHDGKLSYEAAMELKYIDQIIHETLRMYPVVSILMRRVGATYKVPDTEIILEKGMMTVIPVMGFHSDPELFPDPENFNPDRFTKENVAERHPYAWIPFGKGPRDCIGMRFGMMQTRLGIATVLNNFVVSPSENTQFPIRFQPDAQILCPKGGLFLNIRAINGSRE